MKEGYRFVDCDMHIMEPTDLFDKYLDPEFKPRVTSSVRRTNGGPTGMRGRPLWYFDGTPTATTATSRNTTASAARSSRSAPTRM